MAEANRLTGKDLIVLWVDAGGTVDLSGDFRALNLNREQETTDITAGGDSARSYRGTVKKFGAKLETLFIGTAGSAAYTAVALGAEGTLLYGPQGTAVGQPKGGFPAIVSKQNIDLPYDEVVTMTVEFQGQGGEVANPNTDVW